MDRGRRTEGTYHCESESPELVEAWHLFCSIYRLCCSCILCHWHSSMYDLHTAEVDLPTHAPLSMLRIPAAFASLSALGFVAHRVAWALFAAQPLQLLGLNTRPLLGIIELDYGAAEKGLGCRGRRCRHRGRGRQRASPRSLPCPRATHPKSTAPSCDVSSSPQSSVRTSPYAARAPPPPRASPA